jgi:hypothetical protein
MARISLATYAVRIKARYGRESLQLDNAEGQDILAMLDEYVRQRAAHLRDEDEQKVLVVSRHTTRGRFITGIVQTGEWGYRSDLYDVDRQEVSYVRSPREAGLLPFYFRFHLPAGRNEGLLVLQRFQNFGVRTTLSKDIATFIADHFDAYTVSINPILAPEVWRAYLTEGRLVTLRFIRFHVPHDIAAAVDSQGAIEDVATVEYVLKARRNSALPFAGAIAEFVDGRRHWNDFVEITGFDYDTVKAEVEFEGGAKRTIELKDVGSLRAVYDITDEVEIGRDGHPSFASIDGIARRYAEDVETRMGSRES